MEPTQNISIVKRVFDKVRTYRPCSSPSISMIYFAEYCKKWHLKINISKTKIMILGRNTRSNNKIFTLNGDIVEIVKLFKYLGVLFTRNGRFVPNTKQLSNLACKAMYLLRRGIVNLNLPFGYQLKLFDQTVVPVTKVDRTCSPTPLQKNAIKYV